MSTASRVVSLDCGCIVLGDSTILRMASMLISERYSNWNSGSALLDTLASRIATCSTILGFYDAIRLKRDRNRVRSSTLGMALIHGGSCES